MNTELYIARRISNHNKKSKLSQSIIKINIAGIALGVAVMIISISVVTGFKKQITDKVIGFAAHIQITNFDANNSYETEPISTSQTFLPELEVMPGITHVNCFANKYGVLKKGAEFQGLVFKGVGSDFNPDFINSNLVKGFFPVYSDTARSNLIVISEWVANKLLLDTGDLTGAFFIQDPPRARRFKIAGIYSTTLEEFDKLFTYCDIKHLQKLNNWTDNQVSGFEIYTDNYKLIDDYYSKVYRIAGMTFLPDGSKLRINSIKQKYPHIFDWLNLQDMNVWVILCLMLLIAGFNLISGLLILILDRTHMIGLLKAMGTNSRSLKKIFIYQSSFLAIKGLLIGNIIGIGLCLLQQQFNIIRLDQSAYFLNSVPINLSVSAILLLNLGTFALTLLMLQLPLRIISNIEPSKSIRFE